MAKSSPFSKVEPEYVKVVIPIVYYIPDENLADLKLDLDNFNNIPDFYEESDFAKIVLPISASEKDDQHTWDKFEAINFEPMPGDLTPNRFTKPNHPGMMM